MFGIHSILIPLSVSIALIHTLMGPDHYLPFIVMAKARNWSLLRTLLITITCGVGHVLSSVIIGIIGVGCGTALSKITLWETLRGDIAGWLLLTFGFTYFVWGVFRAIKNTPHTHSHYHNDGTTHCHHHTHCHPHIHPHGTENKADITPWILFTIFVFGPCEPLIPLLMYPAAQGSLLTLAIITTIFAITTIATMSAIVTTALYSTSFFSLPHLQRYGHALAGLAITASGAAITILGL